LLKRTAHITVVCVGFAATIAQIVLMRELVVAFEGNEVALGLALGCWLLWTGAGSIGFSRLVDRKQLGVRAVIVLSLALALLLPATVFAARLVRLALGTSGPGEIVSLERMALSSLCLLAPVCLVNGALFSLLCRVAAIGDKASTSVGRVYVYESVGSVAGGALFTFALVHVGSSLPASWMASGALVLVSALLCWQSKARRFGLSFCAAILLSVVSGALLTGRIDRWSAELLWRPHAVRDVTDTPYGRLVFLELAEQRTILSNGHILASYPPGPDAEDIVHFAMLSHASLSPRARVLVVGGGLSGALSEILKYPVASAQYVELDGKLLRTARRVFPAWADAELGPAPRSSPAPRRPHRPTILEQDGREVVEAAARCSSVASGRGADSGYDVIIIDLPPPYNAQLNRYYTAEFFRHAAAALAPDGILAFRLPSSETYIGAALQPFLQSIARSVNAQRPGCCGSPHLRPATNSDELFNVAVVPGQTNIFLCSRGARPSLDPQYYQRKLKQYGIATEYFEAALADRLHPYRTQQIEQSLRDRASALANTDLRPICYFYDAVLWSALFRRHGLGWGGGRLLLALQGVNIWWVGLGAGLVTLALIVAGRKSSRVRRSFVLLAVAATGFAEITAEVLCLIGFQIAHGTVYYLVGGIIAAYMAGLTLGSALMTRLMKPWGLKMLVKIQVAVAVYLALMAVCIGLLVTTGWELQGLSALAFALLTFGAGFLGGFQFPLAAKVFLGRSVRAGEKAGMVYGADLFGSCAGAFAASAVMIPLMGVIGTAFAAGALAALSAVLLCFGDT